MEATQSADDVAMSETPMHQLDRLVKARLDAQGLHPATWVVIAAVIDLLREDPALAEALLRQSDGDGCE